MYKSIISIISVIVGISLGGGCAEPDYSCEGAPPEFWEECDDRCTGMVNPGLCGDTYSHPACDDTQCVCINVDMERCAWPLVWTTQFVD